MALLSRPVEHAQKPVPCAICVSLRPNGQSLWRSGQLSWQSTNLTVRKVYGQDRIRLLRCRPCGEEFSERRSTALFNTKITEEQAVSVINHLGEGCGTRATARLVRVSQDTVARLLRMAGRHAERFHAQRVHDVTP